MSANLIYWGYRCAIGKSTGKGPDPHPWQLPSKRWQAVLRYRGERLYIGTHPTQALAQAVTDAARAYTDTGPSLEELKAWIKR